jgi:hypothetical protein
MELDSRVEFKNDVATAVDDFILMPQPDRRENARQISVMLVAKLDVAGRELLCRVHNISSGGAKIETRAKMSIGDEIRIEFRSNLSIAGTVRWHNGAYAGVEFTEAADLDAVLKKTGISIARVKPRLPRYNCKVPAKLESDQRSIHCEAIDISANGVRLDKVRSLKPAENLTLVIAGLSRRKVSIVWNRDEQAGVKFMNPLRYDEFEDWLAWNQDESSARPEAKGGANPK